MNRQEPNQGQTTFFLALVPSMDEWMVQQNKRGLSLFWGSVTT
jgi:hypothetical protein